MISIGPTIGIKGEKEFRATLKELISDVQKYGAEMDRLTASFDKNNDALTQNAKKHELLKTEIEKQSEVVAYNSRMRNDAIAAYNRTEQALEKQRTKVATLNTSYEEQKKKVEELTAQYGKNHPEVEKATKELEAQKKELGEATKKLDDMNVSIHRSGQVVNEWNTKLTQSETELDNLRREFENTRPIRAWGETFQNVSDNLTTFGDAMSKYVTAPLTALGGYAIKAAADFQEGMAKIYTIAMDQSEPMEKMQKELVQLSNETGFSLNDLAEATYQTVSASVDATDAVDFMTHAVKLARAGFTTTTKAVDILTTVMNSYGKETYDVAYLNDLLLKTQNDGKVIIDQLASSIGVIIPLAANYHVGIEQIAAAYATMTKQGVPAERATTFMRALFTELEKQGKGVSKVLKDETGKSFAQLMDAGWSLADVLELLYNKMDKNSEAYQQLFKNVRSGQAAASLGADGFKVLRTELSRMNDVAGLTDRALEQLETPTLKAKRAANQLKNSAENLGETMIDMLLPTFLKATDGIRKMTDSFIALTPESKELIVNAIALTAAIGPVATIMGKIIGYIGALMTGTASLVPLIGAVSVGLVGMYTAAMVAAAEEESLRQAEFGLNEETKAAIDNVYALKQAHEESVASMQAKNAEIATNANYIQSLAEQYDLLVDKNGKVKKGSEELAAELIGELANALGISRDDVQKLIDKHGKLSESIQKTIEDYKNEAMAAVMKEELMAATRRLVEAQETEKELVAQSDAAYKTLRDTEHQMQLAKQAITDAEQKGIPVTEEMYRAYDEAAKNYAVAETAVKDLDQALVDSRTFVQGAKNDIDSITKALTGVEAESDKTAEKVDKNGKKAKQSSKDTADGIKANLNSVNSDQISYYMMTGLANGIAKYQYLAERAAANAGRATSRSLKNSVQVASPSKVTAEIGKYFVEGFANSIRSGINEMGYLAEQLGESAINGLSMGSYMPETGAVYNKQITAPISVNLTVNGNVDDPDKFVRDIGDKLADILTRNNEVFA